VTAPLVLEKENVAEVWLVTLGGPDSMVGVAGGRVGAPGFEPPGGGGGGVGGGISTVHVLEAIPLSCPVASCAFTSNLWVPTFRPVYRLGLVHVDHETSSSRHR
jgi:hypothetical protein